MASGYNNIARGYCSAAIGMANEVAGDYSFVTGYQSYCSHQFSAIIGSFDTITNFHSFILGSSSKATGKNAIVVGNDSKSLANFALSLGYHVQSRANEAFTIGAGIVDNPLENGYSQSLFVGFNSNLPTFIVDRAPGADKTGRIGIGNVPDPQAKLHIRSDWNESALIRIENTNSDSIAGITFGEGSQSITTSQEMPFTFNSGQNDYFFESGRVGIGTTDFGNNKLAVAGNLKAEGLEVSGDIFIEDIDHGIIMKSPDGNCWRGTLNNLGQLQFAQVDCDELTVSTPEPEPAQNSGIRIYPNPTGNLVNVEIPAGKTGAQLSIKSADGKELRSSTLKNSSNSIDISNYKAGVYVFYSYHSGNLLDVKKVVKE